MKDNKTKVQMRFNFSKFNSFLRCHRQILFAIILQDMKTRFGGGYSGYLVATAWPLAHLAVIVIGYLLMNQYAPVGSDPLIFILTGCLPYILCQYPTRLIAISATVNKPFLNYNIISFHHIVLARSILEFLNASAVVLIVVLACYVTGNDVLPHDPTVVAKVLAASIFFGASLGFLFATLTAIMGPLVVLSVVLFGVGMYLSSLVYVPDYLIPADKRKYLDYNPMFVLISLLRSAYFPSYALNDLSLLYVIYVSCLVLFLGLLLERLLSRPLKNHKSPEQNRERNGTEEDPNRNRTAAEMSFSTAC